jgi:hypothetical protein
MDPILVQYDTQTYVNQSIDESKRIFDTPKHKELTRNMLLDKHSRLFAIKSRLHHKLEKQKNAMKN